MKKLLFSAFVAIMICAFTFNIQAQNFQLVKDINTSKDGNPANLIDNKYFGYLDNYNSFYIHNPENGAFAVMNGVAYFAADDGIHSTGLWRSDSTEGGTNMVFSPGSASTKIESITVVGNKLFFTVNTNVYKSDGTESGTVAVPRITYDGDPTTCLTPAGNILYFFTNFSRLWKTDGTEAGTFLIKDFRNIPNSADFLGQLTNVNGTLFFTNGIDNTYGAELWKSDGTALGTVMVKDIKPGIDGSRPSNLTAVKGKLYFSANDGSGIRLWVSDGTADGTKPVVNNVGATLQQDIDNIGTFNITLDVTPFSVIKKNLYFKAYSPTTGYELYKYNIANAAAGISLVKDIVPGIAGSDPSNLTVVDSTLYFSISGANGNQQLWKSDGTLLGTTIIKDMGPGDAIYFSDFANANGQLLFSYFTYENGMELWRSNGTLSGTTIIKDIYKGNHSSFPGGITYLKNGVSLFSSNDGTKGIELWRTNGNKSGTVMIKNINNTTTSGSNPILEASVSLNNKFYFSAYDPVYGNGLYISDGTSGGTQLIKDINPIHSSNPSNLTVFKNNVYFSADSLGINSVYKTNGTSPGTKQIFNTGKMKAIVRQMVAAQDYLYVLYNDLDSNNIQLWVSDGSTTGSHKIQNLDPTNKGFPAIANKDTLFFSCFDSLHGQELWKATPVPGSAKLIKDIFPGPVGSYPSQMVPYKNKIYFDAVDASNNRYVYMTEGTKAGTQKLFNKPETQSELSVSGGKLFFGAFDETTGNELYVSNGTTTGTKLLKDINHGINGSYPYGFISMDSILYFTADDGIHGYELWKSNGKAKGTVLVKDIIQGPGSSAPSSFTIAAGKLYFRAASSFSQVLYVSNGTADGTKEVVDAGLEGLTINSFIGGGNKLYINGYTYALGNELYAGISPGLTPQINNAVANNLIKNEKFTALILGNPLQDELKLSVNSIKAQQVQVIITDASGKLLVNKSESLYAGTNNVAYSTSSWPSGIYTLKIIAADGSGVQLKAVK